jgi:5-methylcytosine-specific restriction enzyme A
VTVVIVMIGLAIVVLGAVFFLGKALGYQAKSDAAKNAAVSIQIDAQDPDNWMQHLLAQQRPDHGLLAAEGVQRSGHWRAVEKAHLAKEPGCAACGKRVSVQVHHRFPFHYCIALGRPDLELDQRNLITLCEGPGTEDHHLLIGHLDDFKSSNLSVDVDARSVFATKTKEQIENDPLWMKKRSARLKPLSEMSAVEKADFKALMNRTFPLEVKS